MRKLWGLATFVLVAGCVTLEPAPDELVVYSGRTEMLVDPVIEDFQEQTGVRVRVQYAGTAQLAATLLEEGDRSPADLFLAQDSSSLAVLEGEGMLAELPHHLTDQVELRYRSSGGGWVGISGRARVLAYRTDRVNADELPTSLTDLTHERWAGRLGWAPSNASFQSMVNAMVQIDGPERTQSWLEGMQDNHPRVQAGNAPLLASLSRGEVDLVLTNHYYLHRFQDERGGNLPIANHYLNSGDPGSLVDVAAAGVLASSPRQELALQFIEHLLSESAQAHFAQVNHEFPLARDVTSSNGLPQVAELNPPHIDHSAPAELQKTVWLLRASGALP